MTEFIFIYISYIGFKATMIYERCLEERNLTLASLGLSSLELTSLPPEGTIIYMGNNETQVMPTIPECDLQKELDNVSTLSILSNQLAPHYRISL